MLTNLRGLLKNITKDVVPAMTEKVLVKLMYKIIFLFFLSATP